MRLAHELLETWAPAKLPQPGVCRGEREPGTGPTSERAFPGGRGRERPGPLLVLWLRPWQPLLPASPTPAELCRARKPRVTSTRRAQALPPPHSAATGTA